MRALASAVTASGGFTYRMWGAGSPESGKVLSLYPQHEKILTIEEWDSNPVGHLRSYLTSKRTFVRARKGRYVGAWHDAEAGRVYLDVSEIVGTDAEARRLARLGGQEAYFDLDSGETIFVKDESERRGIAKGRAKPRLILADPEELLADEAKLEEFARAVTASE